MTKTADAIWDEANERGDLDSFGAADADVEETLEADGWTILTQRESSRDVTVAHKGGYLAIVADAGGPCGVVMPGTPDDVFVHQVSLQVCIRTAAY